MRLQPSWPKELLKDQHLLLKCGTTVHREENINCVKKKKKAMSLLLLEGHVLFFKMVREIEGLQHQGQMTQKAFSEVLHLVTHL